MTRFKKLGLSVSAAVLFGAACSSYVELDTVTSGSDSDCFDRQFNAAKAEITARYQSQFATREAIRGMSDDERAVSLVNDLKTNDRMNDEIHAARLSSRRVCDALASPAR